ncbi:MAG: restriction endonuclease [Lutibacter sp.]
MKKNTGIKFEKLVESIYKNLHKNTQNSKIEHNKKLMGADGLRQIDILITSEIVDIKILTIIECKDYYSKISVGTIDAFHSKLLDINANKGILISRNGFSKTSISKAKRLGITLCTANEALNDNWRVEIDAPVIIEEIKPNGFQLTLNGTYANTDFLEKDSYPKINDYKIDNLIDQKWKNGTLNFLPKSGMQKIELEELKPPYILQLANGIKREINYAIIQINFQYKYYETSISQLAGTKILNNISDGKTNIFLDIPSILALKKDLKSVKNNRKDIVNGLIISYRVHAELIPKPNCINFEKTN